MAWTTPRHRGKQALLVALFVFEVFDFFGRVRGGWELLDWLVSWALFGYLLYQASLSQIFFGQRSRGLDAGILAAYFLLMAYKVLGFAVLAMADVPPSSAVVGLYEALAAHAHFISAITVAAGVLLLVGLALFVGWRTPFQDPSIAVVFRLPGEPRARPWTLAVRAGGAFLVLFGFFLTVFNLMAEWLVIVLDAPILMLCLLVYLLAVSRHFRLARGELAHGSWLHRVEGAAENFYAEFLKHFVYKETLWLGLGGMLVLHLITDIGNFLFPYLFAFSKVLYLESLGAGHEPIWTLLARQAQAGPGWGIPVLGLAYLLNLVALLLLLTIPAYLWYVLYRHRQVFVPRRYQALFYFCLPSLLLAPIFTMSPLGRQGEGLVGIDIRTQPVPGGAGMALAALAVGAGLLLLVLLARGRALEKLWVGLGIGSAFGFFTFYAATYIWDYLLSLFFELRAFLAAQEWAFAAIFSLMLGLSGLAYLGGYLAYAGALAKKVWHFLKY